MRLFVYGTLKKGYPLHNHTLGANENTSFISDGSIAGFDMYTNGAYPYIVEVDDKSRIVQGEIYEVNDAVLLTQLRGIEREYEETPVRVTLENGSQEDCIAYVYKNSIRESWSKIESGVFQREGHTVKLD